MKTKLHIVLIVTLSLMLFLFPLAVAHGATYYVDASATGNNDGSSWEHAWTNINDAFRTATYGDTVLIRDGNYGQTNNPISFPAYAGSMTEPLPEETQFITFKADAGHNPVLTGISITSSSPIYTPYIFDSITINSSGDSVYFSNIVGPRFLHCTITGPFTGEYSGDDNGFWIRGGNDIRIENCEISHHYRATYTSCSNLAIKNCDIHYCGDDVMLTGSGTNILIEGNHLYDQYRTGVRHPDAIPIHGTINNLSIKSNRIHGMKSEGIFFHGGSIINNVLIENNLIYDTAGPELSGYYPPSAEIYNVTVRHNIIIADEGDGGYVSIPWSGAVYNNIFIHTYWTRADIHDYNIYWAKTGSAGLGENNSYGYSSKAAALTDLFTDADNHNYTLRYNSPEDKSMAIGFGTTEHYGSQGWGTPTDIDGNLRDSHPDAGCYEYGASPPLPQPPIADAGLDQTITDKDKDGSEQVTLDGSASFDPDGEIVSFIWSEGGLQIATGINPTVTLSTGTHLITLTVTDNGGLTDTDTVTIKVLEGDKEFGKLPTGCYNNVIKPLKGEKAIIMGEIEKRGYVKISLYDTKGKKIRELADEERDAGPYKYYWEGKNDSGNVVGSGLYFVHIQAGDFKKTKKIVVVK